MFVFVYMECTDPFELIHSSNVPKGSAQVKFCATLN